MASDTALRPSCADPYTAPERPGFSSSAMKIKGVPVFYMPYMVWPVKQERSAGLLFPRFGYSNTRGFNFGLPLYVPLGRSFDTTVFADYYSQGFFGLGNKSRLSSGQFLFALFDPGFALL